jgi:integrase
MKLKLRQKRYWLHGTIAGNFRRLPLGTGNKESAAQIANDIERALAQSERSELWPELKRMLPPRTFAALAAIVHYREPEKAPSVPTWQDLEGAFSTKMHQSILLGKMAESTRERYNQAIRAFKGFLKETGVSELPAMNRPFIEKFKVWRLAKIQEKKFSRGGRGLSLDVAILHRAFAIAVECELIVKNPVGFEGRPGDAPEHGAQPFRGEQLINLRAAAKQDLLAYLLLRWTGLRGSDAVRLTWDDIDWQAREINRLTQKRKIRVVLPVPQELFFALEIEKDRRQPDCCSRVLVNPQTGKPMTRPRLYQRMLALGKRAGISDAHPHRYRDTLPSTCWSKEQAPTTWRNC